MLDGILAVLEAITTALGSTTSLFGGVVIGVGSSLLAYWLANGLEFQPAIGAVAFVAGTLFGALLIEKLSNGRSS